MHGSTTRFKRRTRLIFQYTLVSLIVCMLLMLGFLAFRHNTIRTLTQNPGITNSTITNIIPYKTDWNEIVFPPLNISLNRSEFAYKHLLGTNLTINRQYYRFELIRLLGISPLDPVLIRNDITLVIGSDTPIGKALCDELKKSGTPVLSIRSDVEIDFTANVTSAIFDSIHLDRICYFPSPFFYPDCTSNGSDFISNVTMSNINGISQLAQAHGANLEIYPTYPYLQIYQAADFCANASVVYLPTPIDFDTIVSNPFGRLYRECSLFGESYYSPPPHFALSPIDPHTIAMQLLTPPQHHLSRITVSGGTLPLSEAIRAVSPTCKLHGKDSPHVANETFVRTLDHTTELHSIGTVSELLSMYQPNATKPIDADPYLSILISVRRDTNPDAAEEVQSYIDRMAEMVVKFPLANVELVVTEGSNVTDGALIRESLTIPPALAGKVTLVDVPMSAMWKRPFAVQSGNGPFLQNVGARTARGKFLMFTQRTNHHSATLFEQISLEQFNDGIPFFVADSLRPEYIQVGRDFLNEPWLYKNRKLPFNLQLSHIDRPFADLDTNHTMHPDIMDAMKWIETEIISKALFEALGGFPDDSGDTCYDAILAVKLYSVLPGPIIMFSRVIDIRHVPPRALTHRIAKFNDYVEVYMDKLTHRAFDSEPDWGLITE